MTEITERIMTYDEFRTAGKEFLNDEGTMEIIIEAFKCGVFDYIELALLDVDYKPSEKIKIILKEGE